MVSPAPLVSVVTRTYQGRLPWLEEAVTSVINQTYPNIELIVVEDALMEPTLTWIR
ncbi:MAG: glycosyltransferase [Propionivibrio sp.]|nr:glycosyltransferase [Propionivibrio sp.]